MRLKHACSLYGDYGLNISADEYVDDGVPLIRTSDFDDAGCLHFSNPKMVRESAAVNKMLQYGDVLFSRAGTIGRCMVFDRAGPATFAAYLVRFRPCPSKVETRFIGWWAQSSQYWNQVRADAIESTIGNFNAAKLGNLELPNLDLDAQKAIANFLDRETPRIDQLIEKKKRLVEVTNFEFLNRVTWAVTRGLELGSRTKLSGYDWHPIIPEHWTPTRLKFLCSRIVDCLHETPVHDDEGEYPSIRTSDVRPGKLVLEGAKRVSEAEYRNRIQRLEPAAGDVVYTREGERFGIAALVPSGAKLCLGQRMMMLRVNQYVVPDYLMWSLNGAFAYHYLKQDTAGATSPHLNIFDIRNTPIFLPPTDEQENICADLGRRFTIKERTVALVEKTIAKLHEFRSALVTAAVTGQIDVTTWGTRGHTVRRLDEIEQEMAS